MSSSAKALSADESLLEVAPGIFRVRLALPFRLNHVNCYVLEDHDGWTVFDTGYSDDNCKPSSQLPADKTLRLRRIALAREDCAPPTDAISRRLPIEPRVR